MYSFYQRPVANCKTKLLILENVIKPKYSLHAPVKCTSANFNCTWSAFKLPQRKINSTIYKKRIWFELIQGYHNEIVANVMSDIYLTIRTEDTLHQHHSIARYYTGFKFPLFGNEADAFILTHQPCGHPC